MDETGQIPLEKSLSSQVLIRSLLALMWMGNKAHTLSVCAGNDGVVAPWLRAFVGLAEDLAVVSRAHIASHSHLELKLQEI